MGCGGRGKRQVRPSLPDTGDPQARKLFEQSRVQFEKDGTHDAGFVAIARDFPDDHKLGNSFLYKVHDELWVYNMVAQHGYGPSDHPRIRYFALESCLERLKEEAIDKKAAVLEAQSAL